MPFTQSACHYNSNSGQIRSGAPVQGRPGATGGRPETAGSSAASTAAQRRAQAFPPWCVWGRRSAQTGAAQCAGSISSPSTMATTCAQPNLPVGPPVSSRPQSETGHLPPSGCQNDILVSDSTLTIKKRGLPDTGHESLDLGSIGVSTEICH